MAIDCVLEGMSVSFLSTFLCGMNIQAAYMSRDIDTNTIYSMLH